MDWYDSSLPMRPRYGLTFEDFDAMEDQYFIQLEDEIIGEDWLESFATEMLDAKYLTHWPDGERWSKLNFSKEHPPREDFLLKEYTLQRVEPVGANW